jgi:mannose-6-phosphate isomerase
LGRKASPEKIMTLTPLLLETIFVNRAWGGLDLLRMFHPGLPAGGKVGESWNIASYPTADCRMLTGLKAGLPLSALLKIHGQAVLGRPWTDFADFPLLLKFLAPTHDLALQVHPGDAYARRVEGQNGKTECWIILDCKPGAKLWLGLKDVRSLDELENIVIGKTLPLHVQRVQAEPGDIFFVPAGLVHALGSHMLTYEVQQNSDVTYRMEDFGLNMDPQKVRSEHCRKALEVIDLEANLRPAGPAERWGKGDGKIDFPPYFGFELKTTPAGQNWKLPRPGVCKGLTIMEGGGRISSPGFASGLDKGQSWLLPAELEKVEINGPCRALLTFFPV